MLTAQLDVFGGAVWDAKPKTHIRIPAAAEAQQTVLKALLETPLREQHRNPLDWVASLAVHAIVLTALVVTPLFFTQMINLHNLQLTYLVTPAPPTAPAPPAAGAVRKLAPRKLMPTSKLVAPSVIPRRVVIVREPEAPPDVTGGVIGGVAGGVTGGVLSGIIGGVVTNVPPLAPAPAMVSKSKEILRVGGNVQPPRKLFAPAPRYPPLAQAAHVVGTVVIEAVIDEKGNVVNAHAIQGHPLLIPEALRTVMEWKYEPTYLNGVAYPVQMTVTVNFSFAS